MMKAIAICLAAVALLAPLALAERDQNLQGVFNPLATIQGLKNALNPFPVQTTAPVTTAPVTVGPTTTTQAPPITLAPITTTQIPPVTVAPLTTQTPLSTAAPVSTSAPTTPPATTVNFLPTKVDINGAETYQPFVEQAGSQPNFPSATSGPFALTGNVVRYVAIGDFGRTSAPASVGAPQCTVSGFGGDNEVQGGLQQAETAQLADQVCSLIGGCNGIINTGDNFYECGVYPGDTSQRFLKDWQNIYQTSLTPNLANLTWYTTFGNHDIVINGSVEAQINFSSQNKKWYLPETYYTVDLPTPAGGPTIRAIFVDANPFIEAYNTSSKAQYNTQYFQSHLNQNYVQKQQADIDAALAASTANYNIVIGHYPLYGTSTQYAKDAGAYPGNFNTWANLLASIFKNRVTSYINGHDHSMAVGNPVQPDSVQAWNNYTTFLTTGAGSWGETGDSCGAPGSFFYSNGGDGGFFIISANATVFQSDFFTLGSLFSQCTVTSFADKTKAPIYSPNCALGQPNACCNADGASACYRKK